MNCSSTSTNLSFLALIQASELHVSHHVSKLDLDLGHFTKVKVSRAIHCRQLLIQRQSNMRKIQPTDSKPLTLPNILIRIT